MKEYKTLSAFLEENLVSGGEGDFDFLTPYLVFRKDVKNCLISASNIRAILELTLQNPQFSWRELALGSPGFIPPSFILSPAKGFEVTEADIFNYFKMLTWDVLYPQRWLSPLQEEQLRRSIYHLLKGSAKSGQDWVSVEEILQKLKSTNAEWSNIEEYNIQLLYEPYRREGLIEVKWKCLMQISHLRVSPDPAVDNYLIDLIKDQIEPFVILPDYKN